MTTNFRSLQTLHLPCCCMFKVTFGPIQHLNPSFLICQMHPKNAHLPEILQGLKEIMLGKLLRVVDPQPKKPPPFVSAYTFPHHRLLQIKYRRLNTGKEEFKMIISRDTQKAFYVIHQSLQIKMKKK